jgi:hypothetical protein
MNTITIINKGLSFTGTVNDAQTLLDSLQFVQGGGTISYINYSAWSPYKIRNRRRA